MKGLWKRLAGIDRHTLALSLPLGLLAVALAPVAVSLPYVGEEWLGYAKMPGLLRVLRSEGLYPELRTTLTFVLAVSLLALLAGFVLGFVRRPSMVGWVRAGYISACTAGLGWFYMVFRVTGAAFAHELERDGGEIDSVILFFIRWEWSWPVLLVMAFAGLLYLASWRRTFIAAYTGYRDEGPAPGDRVVENIRRHGPDPRYRKSVLSSATLHLLIIVIIPWLLAFWGCVTPYRVPKGSGHPAVAVMAVKKPKKKKKKEYILNPNSLISFKIPEIDDSEVFQEVEQQTLLTYKATARAKGGPMGRGGGKTGGWPDGMEDHLVRFIRLKYRGANWDDGRAPSQGADRNFLDEFKKLTGFNVAEDGEAHAIRLLRKYPKGYAPPFVYMTGSGGISVSDGEKKALRDYLKGGGLLFADAGSATWDGRFRSFIRGVLPGKRLLVVADDDPLFQQPYVFPHGAPPLWHHGGFRALGMKHEGRWCVFYHPGDVNDAWKTGHSGIGKAQAEEAFQVGVNLVYYAFTHYLEETREYRK
ncbi:MAG: DUF4159 domain-containing protein [Lentisphaerae bacterium]|nr:DUF4159 domain-containing protein [Lentisphaerota bacterium]